MDDESLPKRSLRKRAVSVRFAEDADFQVALTLRENRRQEGKENARKKTAEKPETPSRRRSSLRSANDASCSSDGKLIKIGEEELPDEFTERLDRPSALLGDDGEQSEVGFQTPRKRNSMFLKAQESATKYSSPQRGSGTTPSKTPRRNGAEDVHSTSSRRVSFGGVMSATPSKGDGTPTKSSLRKRENTIGTPNISAALRVQNTTPSKLKGPSVIEKTPARLRAKTKAAIQKSVADLESDGDFSSDEESYKPTDESSDSSSDEESEVENDPPNREFGKQENKSMQMASTAQRHFPSKASLRKAKEEKDFEICTDLYFETQSEKSRTSNNTLSKLKNPRLQQDTLLKLLADENSSHRESISQLSNEFNAHLDQWLFSLWEGYSILLYGLGSKRHILQFLHQERLSNCNVLVVNGFFPGVTVKNVIDDILTEILEVKEVSSNLIECVNHIEAIQSTKQAEPLYLLVHNLDGGTFRNERTQAVFSHLAQIPKVHLIASIDHINAPLLWDQAKLRRFNFVWWDVTTFLDYSAETAYESSMLIQQSGALALSSLNSVFKSLIPNSKKIFLLIAKNQLDNAKNHSFSGISFRDLYWKCRNGFLASSDRVLRAQLMEVLDHRLLKQRRGTDGIETLFIPIESGILSQFLEFQEQEESK